MSDALYDSQQQQPNMTPAVQWLLAANIGVYFLQLTLFRSEAVYLRLGYRPRRRFQRGDACYLRSSIRVVALAFNMSRYGCSGRVWSTDGARAGSTYLYIWCGLARSAHLLLQGNASRWRICSGEWSLARMPSDARRRGLSVRDDPDKTRWLVVWRCDQPGNGVLDSGWVRNSVVSHLGGLASAGFTFVCLHSARLEISGAVHPFRMSRRTLSGSTKVRREIVSAPSALRSTSCGKEQRSGYSYHFDQRWCHALKYEPSVR